MEGDVLKHFASLIDDLRYFYFMSFLNNVIVTKYRFPYFYYLKRNCSSKMQISMTASYSSWSALELYYQTRSSSFPETYHSTLDISKASREAEKQYGTSEIHRFVKARIIVHFR